MEGLEASIFKAYDIRGIVGETLTLSGMNLLGQALGSLCIERGIAEFVVGRDERLSSESLSEALIEGVLASGCDVLDIGEVPTPLLYFAAEKSPSKSGLMITGSHNPAEYNGLKMVLSGEALSSQAIQNLSVQIKQNNFKQGEGRYAQGDFRAGYIKEISQGIKFSRQVRVVVDAGNGVAGPMIVPLLESLGCEVIPLYCEVDGHFPHHHPNPSEPENMQDLIAQVLYQQADLGLAFDGDGDRLGVVDERGEIIWPDRQLALYAQKVLALEAGAVIVYDVKSSSYLKQIIESSGGIPEMTASGYPRIKQAMKAHASPLGGEMSGHIFFNDRWYGFDDALYTACRLLEIVTDTADNVKVSTIFSALPAATESTPELMVPMVENAPMILMKAFTERASFEGAKVFTLDGVRVEYPDGWGLVRASHTTPCLVLRFEADNKAALQRIQQQFKTQLLAIEATLNLPI